MNQLTRASSAICAAAMVLTAASITVKHTRRPQVAGDLAVPCGALAAMRAHENPYDPEVLRRYTITPGIPMTYPPLAASALAPACPGVRYLVLWPLVAALSVLVLVRKAGSHPLAAAAAVFSGFGAFEWALLTANPVVWELPVMSLALVALAAGRARRFGAAIGAAAFLKLSPLTLIPPAIGRLDIRGVLTAAAAAVAVVGSLTALSAWRFPEATAAYWRALPSGFDGFLQLEQRAGGQDHPALLSLAFDVAILAGLPDWSALLFWLTGVMAAGVVAAYAWRTGGTRSQLATCGILMLLVTIVMPRVKPYSFASLAPLIVLLLPSVRRQHQTLFLAVACIVPTIAFAATALFRLHPLVPPAPLIKLAFGYVQIYIAAVLVAILLVPAGPGTPSATDSGH